MKNEGNETILFILNLEDITDAPIKSDSYRNSLKNSTYTALSNQFIVICVKFHLCKLILCLKISTDTECVDVCSILCKHTLTEDITFIALSLDVDWYSYHCMQNSDIVKINAICYVKKQCSKKLNAKISVHP